MVVNKHCQRIEEWRMNRFLHVHFGLPFFKILWYRYCYLMSGFPSICLNKNKLQSVFSFFTIEYLISRYLEEPYAHSWRDGTSVKPPLMISHRLLRTATSLLKRSLYNRRMLTLVSLLTSRYEIQQPSPCLLLCSRVVNPFVVGGNFLQHFTI